MVSQLRRDFFHKPPQRCARESIGQTPERKISRQVRQMQAIAHARYLFAHLSPITDEHTVLLDQVFECQLAHLGAVLVMRAVRFGLGDSLSQIAGFGRRRMVSPSAGSAVDRASVEFSPT